MNLIIILQKMLITIVPLFLLLYLSIYPLLKDEDRLFWYATPAQLRSLTAAATTTTTTLLWWPFSRITRVSRYHYGILLQQGWRRWWFCKTCKAPANCHHQQTNVQLFNKSDALPVAQSTASEHWREKVLHFMDFLVSSSPGMFHPYLDH